MIVIRKTQNQNGTYDNQTWNGATPPDGYYAIPSALEAAWKQYAPFATLTIENDKIVWLEDNAAARAAQTAIVDHAAEIASLKQQLTTTDYKILKCYEYSLVGASAPYDIAALHADRQALRDQINALEQ